MLNHVLSKSNTVVFRVAECDFSVEFWINIVGISILLAPFGNSVSNLPSRFDYDIAAIWPQVGLHTF